MQLFKENMILRTHNGHLMLNLVSFRRKEIDASEYAIINSIIEKKFANLTQEETQLVEKFTNEKQLLTDPLVEWYDTQRNLTAPVPTYKINVITLNLTYDCNFHCKYCYQKNFNLPHKRLNISDIEQIHAFIKSYNKLHGFEDNLREVVISGGESLLPQNIPTINHILNSFQSERFKLFTNGVNLYRNSHNIEYKKFSEIQVSLDGPDNIIKHVNNGGDNLFGEIINGLLLLKDLGIKVTIISMLTKETLTSMPEFISLLEKSHVLDSSNISLRFSFVMDYSKRYSLDPNFYSVSEYLEIRKQARRYISGKNNISVDQLYDLSKLSNALYRQPNSRIEGRINMCNVHSGIPLTFGPDGNIYWCSCTNPTQSLGTINSPPVTFDNSSTLHDLMNRNVYKLKCKSCVFRFVCSSGCPLYSLYSNSFRSAYHCGIFSHPLFLKNAESFLGW